MNLNIKEKYTRQERRNLMKEKEQKRQLWSKIVSMITAHNCVINALPGLLEEKRVERERYCNVYFILSYFILLDFLSLSKFYFFVFNLFSHFSIFLFF
jgi:hypothetical protein